MRKVLTVVFVSALVIIGTMMLVSCSESNSYRDTVDNAFRRNEQTQDNFDKTEKMLERIDNARKGGR